MKKIKANTKLSDFSVIVYKALWAVAIYLLVCSAFLCAVYCWGDVASDFFGQPRFEAWQAALHRVID